MSVQAQLADGSVLEFPDGTDRSVIDSVVRRHVQAPPSTLEDVAKSVAVAPAKAALGLAGLPGDIRDLGSAVKSKALSYLPDWAQQADKITSAVSPMTYLPKLFPTSGELRKPVEAVTGPLYEPQTRAGKIADTATQAATTFGRSLATNTAKALPVIAGITAGTEGAGALTQDSPGARFVGGLVGGGIPAGLQAMRSRPGVILKDALGNMTPEQIAAAQARQEMAQAQGVPLLGTESFDAGHQLASAVGAHPSGNAVIEQFMRQRPQQVQGAVQRDIIGPTGLLDTPAGNATRAQQAATQTIGNAEAARSAAVSPFYKAAAGETLPESSLRPVANELQGLLFQAPNNSATERALGGWHKQLFPYEPQATAAVSSGAGRKASGVPLVDPATDDIVTAIRKMGGITPGDEAIGSLSKHYVFPPDPRNGPVWRQSKGNATGTTTGHSLDRMAELLYEKGYIADRNNLTEVMSKIEDQAMGMGTHYSMFKPQEVTDPLANAIDQLTKQLAVKNAPKVSAPPPANMVLPETNVGRLNEIYKNLGIERQLPEIGATAEQKMASYPAGKVQDVLGEVLRQGSPNIARGQQTYSDITRNVIEPLRAGPVGMVAGKSGFSAPDVPPVQRIVGAVADSTMARPETIRTLYSNLNKTDKQAFPGIVQTHLENQLNTAMGDIRSGPNPTAGAKFRQAIVGTPQEQANFNEMMRGVAQASGADAGAVVAGANNLLQTLERTGRTPGLGSATATRGDIGKEMGKTLLGDTLSTVSITPTKPLARRLDDWIQRGRYEDMAKALTAPDSVQILAKMAKLDPKGVTAQFYAATLLGLDRAISGGQ